MDGSNSQDRFVKQIKLVLTLLDGRYHTAQQLAEQLGTTRRNIYYTLRQFESAGFTLQRSSQGYSIHPMSPFFQQIVNTVAFSHREAVYLHGLLSAAAGENALAALMRRKVERFYNIDQRTEIRYERKRYLNTVALEKAMKHRRVVVLHDYSSSHSGTVTDRLVEPFLFLGDKEDVRAFEIKSGVNKTFKVSRIGRVEELDTPWFNEEKHRQVFTDLFMFSGEELHDVVLRMDLLARNLLIEEYPRTELLIVPEGSDQWRFETRVVKFEGIARFIIGLWDHIEIVESAELRQFVKQRVEALHCRMLSQEETPSEA